MFDINSILFENISEHIQGVGEKIAIYQSHYEHLDDMTKVILAKMASKHEWSEATRQRLAYTDIDYEKHLEARKIARAEMLRNKTYMSALESKHSYCMSINSTERAKINLR